MSGSAVQLGRPSRRTDPRGPLRAVAERSPAVANARNALETADARALEMHLEGCEDCTAFLATYRGTVKASRRLRESQLPAQLRERLLAFLGQHRHG